MTVIPGGVGPMDNPHAECADLDTLAIEHASESDARFIRGFDAYDYVNQQWVKADHAHYRLSQDNKWQPAPLLFCGADRVTCQKGHPGQWALGTCEQHT